MSEKSKNTFYLVMKKPDAYAVFPDDFNTERTYKHKIVALFGNKADALQYAELMAHRPHSFQQPRDMSKRYNEYKIWNNDEDDYDEDDGPENTWAIEHGYF